MALATPMRDENHQFTEAEYTALLRLLKRNWEPVRFPRFRDHGKTCLWRHDVDASVQRAARLANIEAAEKVTATYFIHLHSIFYNALEPVNASLIRNIASLGHDIGLHFDVAFYRHDGRPGDLLNALALEKSLLENLTGVRVQSFSLHNPDEGKVDLDEAAGMVNAYGAELSKLYKYVSDSNGYWRFDPLSEMLERGTDEKLHVLTHPEWWTPEPMTPRARISRCIDGRSAATHAAYDAALAKSGRKNVR